MFTTKQGKLYQEHWRISLQVVTKDLKDVYTSPDRSQLFQIYVENTFISPSICLAALTALS